MTASLRDLTRKPVSRKIIWETVYRTMKEGDIRSGIIVNTALIDKGMERLIKTRLHRLSPQDREAIFGVNGYLCTLPAKIRMAFALGIIGPQTRADLLAINDVRNVFAHSVRARPLSARSLQQKCESIHAWQVVMSSKEFRDIVFKNTRIRELYDDLYPPGALVLAIGMYAVFIGSDEHKRMPPPKGKTSFLSLKFSPLSA